jgi:hypothetical protein
VSSGGDLAAMAQAERTISPACPALKAEVAGRLAEARRRAAEHERAAQAATARQRAVAEAKQTARAQTTRDESTRDSAAQSEAARGQAANDQTAALRATFDLVQATIASQGALVWEEFIHDSAPAAGLATDWTAQNRFEYSNYTNSLQGCTFSFHSKQVQNGVVTDSDGGVPIREVQIVKVSPDEPRLNQLNAQNGHPTWSVRLQPEIYDLQVIRGDGGENEFLFYDLQTANRVAEAFKHAAALCGVNTVSSY